MASPYIVIDVNINFSLMSSRVLENKINASNIFPFLDTELLKKNDLKYKSYRQVQR